MSELIFEYDPHYGGAQIIESDHTQGAVGEVLYRIDSGNYGEGILHLGAYPIVRYTPTGAVVSSYGQEHFVCWAWRKKWACKTKMEAMQSFHARKTSQITILKGQLTTAEYNLKLIEELINDPVPSS